MSAGPRTVTIRAITVWQPFATLIALGAKHYETRSWSPRYIGPLAIHAATKRDWDSLGLMQREPFRSVLAMAGYTRPEHLPFGGVIALSRLSLVHPSEAIRDRLTDHERAFGDWRDKRFGWYLFPVRPLKTSIPCLGQQGLWEWECPGDLFYLFQQTIEQSGVKDDPECRRHKRQHGHRASADDRDD